MTPFSTLILTRNEARNLPACLAALKACDDVVVLDSHSTDTTVDLARGLGARVYQRPFDDYAAQRNYALHRIAYRHPWVLMIDADEVVTPRLEKEIRSRLASVPSDTTLIFIRRKDFLFGRWLKHSSGYPTWFGRLMRPDQVWVERTINEEYHTQGRSANLKAHLYHYPFNKGFGAWFEKHNRYSSMESALINDPQKDRFLRVSATDTAAMATRKRIKALAYRLPMRPVTIFAALYFVRLGFLDGRAGLTYCLLRGVYEFMIDCKIREAQRRRKGLPV